MNGEAVPQFATEEQLGAATRGWVRLTTGRVIVRVPDAATAIDVEVHR